MSFRGYSYKLVKANREADPELIGVLLGKACIESEVPVSQVAEAFKVSRMTIYSWFTGVSKPHPRKAALILKFLSKIN
jgi:DNA invertase Pin-like site-specific DNA recombinase